jgi:cholinesterase
MSHNIHFQLSYPELETNREQGFSCPKLLNDSYSLNPQRFPDVIGNFTPAGVQFLDVVSQYGAEYREREDCLTLNIWTKHARSTRGSKGKGKAVLVWIYGGGFQFGSTAAEIYNGARIADEEDIIVVSLK